MTVPAESGAAPSTGRRVTLRCGGAEARLDLDAGARLASLVVAGHELLVGSDPDPMRWGSYPMAPWAGRVRHGRFRFDGIDHQLPVTAPPHAIHGTAYLSPWEMPGPDGQDRTSVTLLLEPVPGWPFPARLEQGAELAADGLRLTLRLTSQAPPGGPDMPAMVGWHPWFRREVGGASAHLAVAARHQYELDAEAIPTGRLVAPAPPPWDNCFTGLEQGPTVRWPGVLELDLRSSCDHWVLYTEPEHALCIEPQTDAPDAFNRQPHRLAPGQTLEAWFELNWRTL